MKPHGSLYIRVLPPRMVNDYHRSLMCSRALLIWQNSAKVLTTFMWEREPEFKYTTMKRTRSVVVSLQLLRHRVGLAPVVAFLQILHHGVAAWVY